MLWRRRPHVRKLARRGDARRLVRALSYHDYLTDRLGRVYDLGAGVRRDAALALAPMADTDAVDVATALTRSLQDPSVEVRRSVARALAIRGDRHTVPALADAALTWTDPRYEPARVAAIAALATMDEPETAETCVTIVVDRCEDMDRAMAVLAPLVSNGSIEAKHSALTAATVALWQRTGDPAERAAEVMVWLGPDSVEPLIDLLERRGPHLPAIRALGRLRDLRATDALTPLLSDSSPDVRLAAAVALGETTDLRARGPLLEAGGDPDHRVREAAIAALQRLGPATISPEVFAGPGD
jgi:HEAT repeat protein